MGDFYKQLFKQSVKTKKITKKIKDLTESFSDKLFTNVV
jgi:hypothetical protein